MSRFPIRFGFWRWLLTALGMGPRNSFVEIAPDTVRVRMGWVFRARIPRASIASVQRQRRAFSIGVHGWRGRWLVNGASAPLVGIALTQPTRAYVLGVPVRLREVIVSVADADALMAALT